MVFEITLAASRTVPNIDIRGMVPAHDEQYRISEPPNDKWRRLRSVASRSRDAVLALSAPGVCRRGGEVDARQAQGPDGMKELSAAVAPPLSRTVLGTGWVAHPGAFFFVTPLLNIFAAAVSLVVPGLLGPAEFGRYVVVELLSRYFVLADLGLGPLLDRRVPPMIAAGDIVAADQYIQHVLWTRLAVGGAFAIVAIILAIYLAFTAGVDVGVLAALCSMLFGIFSLIAAGPVAAWRASSRYAPLVLSTVLVNIGLSLPRLIGVWIGGVTGCFIALAVWYGSSAVILQRQLPLRLAARPSLLHGWALLSESFPLFIAFLGWFLYLLENRWVYAAIADHAELGQFAFGSSLLMVIVTTLGMANQIYYPKLAGRIGTAARFTFSVKLLRDLAAVTIGAGACCLCAILFLPAAVEILYPRFIEGVPATRILLASGPPMMVAAWFMPLIVAVGRHPWADAITIYPGSLFAVATGILVGHAVSGIVGAAAGSVLGTLVCPILQVIVLRRAGVILLRHAILIILLVVLTMTVLGAVAPPIGFVR
jgi:O-antigen/teichoic acid export membrane protein